MSWNSKLASELFKPIRRHFERRQVFSPQLDRIWATDLLDLQRFARKNKGFRYLMVCVDLFSKYLWLIPLKSKSAAAASQGLEKLFTQVKPSFLWSDKGTEYVNKLVDKILKKENIKLYHTHNEGKSVIAERMVRTCKTWIYRFMTTNNTEKWIDIVEAIMDKYNSRVQRRIGMSPIDARRPENAHKVFQAVVVDKEADSPKLKVGMQVRISKLRKTFHKGYLPRWTEELFRITKARSTNPPTYLIEDLQGNKIEGSFYESELQRSKQKFFRYKKLKTRKRNGKKQYYVEWLGYKTRSWINDSDIEDQVEQKV